MTHTNLQPASTSSFTFADALAAVQNASSTADQAADRLLAQLTDKELLNLLDGDLPIRQAVKIEKMLAEGSVTSGKIARLGIPGFRFVDGPRGVTAGSSTAFPVTMSRAATWNPDLEREIGAAMGREGRAYGANYSGAVCINLLRHPAWGRAQECYGEDPVLIGQMGSALAIGLRPHVMACVKHYALNSMENSRFKVDVTVDEHALHEIYLPHFKKVVDAGAESVMSSYNSVNGQWAGDSKVLLTDILREEWGFAGFVTSDWLWGLHDPIVSLEAGMEVEMPFRATRARSLPRALKSGRISRALVLQAGRRILSTILRHEAQLSPDIPDRSVIANSEHRALARRAAAQGMVLLKNEPVHASPALPIEVAEARYLVVVGELATETNLGDHGSSIVKPPSTSTPLDGIREAYPNARIDYFDGKDLAAATAAAKSADAAIVVVGMRFDDEGEYLINDNAEGLAVFGFPFTMRWARQLLHRFGPLSNNKRSAFGSGGDRTSLTLRSSEEELILAIADVNPRTVPILIGGSAILMERWRAQVPAVLLAWYPGMEGGRAIADVLTGKQEPSGRLPFSIPTDEAHLPEFKIDTVKVVYDAWWGQRKLDRDGHSAAYPFGFGMGYTTFEVDLISHEVDADRGSAIVRVLNTGSRSGATVIQVYAYDDAAARPVPELIGFQRIELAAGSAQDVDVALDLTPTRQRDPKTKVWSDRPGSWRVVVAQASPEAPGVGAPLR